MTGRVSRVSNDIPPSIISVEEPPIADPRDFARGHTSDSNFEMDDLWQGPISDIDNDQEIIDLLLTDIVEDRETTLQPECVGPANITLTVDNTPDCVKNKLNAIGADYVRKLHHSMALLPEDVRHMFTVEQLFANIIDPDCLKKQVDALYVLASDMSKKPLKHPSSKTIPSPHFKRISSHAA